jgi:hypothetical protein
LVAFAANAADANVVRLAPVLVVAWPGSATSWVGWGTADRITSVGNPSALDREAVPPVLRRHT